MAIQSTPPGGQAGQIQNQIARQPRRVDTEAKIQAATLTGADQLSPGEIKEHQQFYNKTIGDVDNIRGGLVGGCIHLDDSILDKLFPHRKDDKRVDDATSPHIFDNHQAEEVRGDYKKAYNEAKRERTRAERQAEKLGPGTHQLSNGDKVNVSIDKETGKKTVTTTRPDGTRKTVSFDPNEPNTVDVSTRHPDGRREELHQDGTTVTREKTDFSGRSTSDRFSLDKEGDPVRETSGPGEDDYRKTTAHDSGSTDTRELIYREDDGTPVYEDKHQSPGWEFPKPHPWPPIGGPHPWPPVGPILPFPWWRERQPDDRWDRNRIPDLVPFRAGAES